MNGEPVRRCTVWVTDAQTKRLKELGDGSLSAGVRRVLAAHDRPADAPRYEVSLSGLLALIRWCKVTPWAGVGEMLAHAEAEGWLRETTLALARALERAAPSRRETGPEHAGKAVPDGRTAGRVVAARPVRPAGAREDHPQR